MEETAHALPAPASGYAPSTFLERGLVVPFTTPDLAGARVRPGERDRLELIVCNPSGGRGVYILPWSGLCELCVPTVHDRELNAAVEQLAAITPGAIRRLAMQVAAEGLAGRAVAAAAAAAAEAEAQSRTLTNFELLLCLIRQVTPGWAGNDLEAGAKQAVAETAPRLDLPTDRVAAMLEELASLFTPLGVGTGARRACIPEALARVVQLRAAVAARLRGPPALQNQDADLVVAAAALTIAGARATMAAATALLDDVPALLRRWQAEPERVAALVARPEWLLDGWERIAVLWEAGGRDAETMFAELADLVPATPREASQWIGASVACGAGMMRHGRKVLLMQDWRSGAVVEDQIGRNERLIAMTLRGADAN